MFKQGRCPSTSRLGRKTYVTSRRCSLRCGIFLKGACVSARSPAGSVTKTSSTSCGCFAAKQGSCQAAMSGAATTTARRLPPLHVPAACRRAPCSWGWSVVLRGPTGICLGRAGICMSLPPGISTTREGSAAGESSLRSRIMAATPPLPMCAPGASSQTVAHASWSAAARRLGGRPSGLSWTNWVCRFSTTRCTRAAWRTTSHSA